MLLHVCEHVFSFTTILCFDLCQPSRSRPVARHPKARLVALQQPSTVREEEADGGGNNDEREVEQFTCDRSYLSSNSAVIREMYM